jgi:hypothetical protein
VRAALARVAVSAAAALLGTSVFASEWALEIWLGMLGPVLVNGVEWTVIERAWRRSPESLTALRLRLFAGKMVFFGGYVIVVFSAFSLRPIPFAASFVGYFLALLTSEAVLLTRLTRREADGDRPAPARPAR